MYSNKITEQKNPNSMDIDQKSSLEILAGSKIVMETTDVLQIDCSVADKISGALSVMEIT